MIPSINYSRDHVNKLIQAALISVDPGDCTRRILQLRESHLLAGEFSYDLSQGRVFLVAVGKASISMAIAACEVIGDLLFQGVVIAKRGIQVSSDPRVTGDFKFPPSIRLFYAGHPVSDESGVDATKYAIDMLEGTTSNDLVLCLISGGTSALLTQPLIPLDDWQRLVEALLASGCTINELNAIRKKLDTVKGGGLSRKATPATCLSLILSDVIGNPLDVIGSGPTVPNPDDPRRARQILSRLKIQDQLPKPSWVLLEEQLGLIENQERTEIPESYHIVVGDVRRAAQAAVNAALEIGYEAKLLTAFLEGEAREVGRVIGALAKEMKPGLCYVFGGETTVTLRGDGLGSRNLELALASALSIENWANLTIATFATDGDDGPTGAAGAIISGQTIDRARRLGLDAQDFLERNDSFNFFEPLGDLIITGQTGTNVNDLLFLLCYLPE